MLLPDLTVRFTRTREDAREPIQAHPGEDAGWDVYTLPSFTTHEKYTFMHSGIHIALPPGWWAHLVPRSSSLDKHSLYIPSAVIDAGYRGELIVPAIRTDGCETWVEPGRYAQLIFHRVPSIQWLEVPSKEDLPASSRGEGGWGSSGTD